MKIDVNEFERNYNVLTVGAWYEINDLCLLWGLDRWNFDDREYARWMCDVLGLVSHLGDVWYFSKPEQL